LWPWLGLPLFFLLYLTQAATPSQTSVSADAPKTHRQAFIYIVSNGRTADAGQVSKLDRIRVAWESFFLSATEGRMTLNTKLR